MSRSSLTTHRRTGDSGDHAWADEDSDDVFVIEAATVERAPRRQRILKWLVVLAAWVAIAGVLTAGAVAWWYIRQVNPSGEVSEPINFTVNEADSLESISIRLQDQGVITNARVFRYYVENKGGIVLTPGYYQLLSGDHMGNLMRVLSTPPAATYQRVTFPEGFTLEQMGRRAERDLPPMTAEGFKAAAESAQLRSPLQPASVTSLEGLLFPDTYQIAGNETEAQLIAKMMALMERVGRQVNLAEKAAERGVSPYELLIVASLIEREAKFDEDRAKIATVIYNRLFFGMPLQIDASLYYGQDPDTPFVTLRNTPSPYNTYANEGLPPTPIASPGRASIEAALNPAPQPSQGDPICVDLPDPQKCFYLFYVLADDDGHHVFAATGEQHEANVAAAREAGVLG